MGLHFQPAPPAAVSRVLSTFDRAQLEGFIAVAIDLLDLADGDPDDHQSDGDDEDANYAEDDFPATEHWHFVDPAPGAHEDDEDDDPAGTLIDSGEGDEIHDYEGRRLTLPIYGVDQTAGPINGDDAVRAYMLERMESDQ